MKQGAAIEFAVECPIGGEAEIHGVKCVGDGDAQKIGYEDGDCWFGLIIGGAVVKQTLLPLCDRFIGSIKTRGTIGIG